MNTLAKYRDIELVKVQIITHTVSLENTFLISNHGNILSILL